MLSRSQTVALAELLLRTPPDDLGSPLDEACFGQLVMRWLAGEVPIGGRSLSTGCGRPAALAAATAADHRVVSTDAAAQERFRTWCADHAVDLSRTTFEVEAPDAWVCDARDGDLDLVVLNGDQAFPQPVLDWHRVAPALRSGGLLVIADVTRRPAAVVADFLTSGGQPWQERYTATGVGVFTKGQFGRARRLRRRDRWTRPRRTIDQRIALAKRRSQP